jgi:hypothetical protein
LDFIQKEMISQSIRWNNFQVLLITLKTKIKCRLL